MASMLLKNISQLEEKKQTTNQFVISPTNHLHEHLSLQMCLENIWGVTVSKDFQDLVPI